MAENEETDKFSIFHSRIKLNRFDETTLGILQLILPSNDVALSLQLRRTLSEFLQSQFISVVGDASDKPLDSKLLLLDFFVRAFAILSDLQSCLAVRYEGLVMRDSCAVSRPQLRVSCGEWLKFADDAFDSAFYSVAAKACENALLCYNQEGDTRSDNFFENVRSIENILRLKDAAIRLSCTHSVQAQATEYLKKKTSALKESSLSKEIDCPASMSFRNGIKLQNVRRLMHLKNQKQAQLSEGF